MGVVDATCSYSSHMIMVAGLMVIVIGALFIAVIEHEKQLNDNIKDDERKEHEKTIEGCRYAGASLMLAIGVVLMFWVGCGFPENRASVLSRAPAA